MLKILFLLLLPSFLFSQVITKNVKGGANKFGFVTVVPNDFNSTNTYPLVVFLAGISAVGDGSSKALDVYANGELPTGLQQAVNKYEFIVIAPQTGSAYVQGEVDFALQAARKQFNIDTTRQYLTGLSLGAGGCWYYADQSVTNASKFAAMAPIATTWQMGTINSIATAGLPTWAFHNEFDTNGATPANATESLVNAINALNPTVKAAMTIFNQSGHGGWGEAYSIDKIPIPAGSLFFNNPQYNLYEWFKMNQLGKPVPAGMGTVVVTTIPPTKTEQGRIFVNSLGKFVVVYSDGSTSQQ